MAAISTFGEEVQMPEALSQGLENSRSVEKKSLVGVVGIVFFVLSVVVLGSCTASGCINVKVGGGLIIGISAVEICVLVVLMKKHWKTIWTKQRSDDLYATDQEWMGWMLVAEVAASLVTVVVGTLTVSGTVSPFVGGVLSATLPPFLPISMFALSCLNESVDCSYP